MEAGITLRLDNPDAVAGGELTGAVRWEPAPDGAAELAVLWYTEGKGDQNSGIVHFEEFALDERRELPFTAQLPLLPLTYHGHLLKIHWIARVRTGKGRRSGGIHAPFTLKAAESKT